MQQNVNDSLYYPLTFKTGSWHNRSLFFFLNFGESHEHKLKNNKRHFQLKTQVRTCENIQTANRGLVIKLSTIGYWNKSPILITELSATFHSCTPFFPTNNVAIVFD